jgi:outer membrane murein-binding lipoprotein Lpp
MYEKIKKVLQSIAFWFTCNGRDTIIIVGIIVAILLLCCGCKTTKTTINDKSEINENTNVVEDVKSDSTSTNQVKEETTTTKEKETTKDKTELTFGEGGGTYNANTGEFTNVVGAKIDSEKEKLKAENKNLYEKYNQTKNEFEAYKDSVNQANNKLDIESKVEETYQMDWYWFMIIGALLMLIAIVVLRKIPQTSWLLFWI